jgi:WD40 repeat protein/thrombospondin type 3 repeat protein
MNMNESQYQKHEAEQLALAIKDDQITVAPEGKVTIHTAVVNHTPIDDYFDITVKGVPADWVTIEDPVVRVPAGGVKEVLLNVQPPPVPQSRVGNYPLDVYATSQSDPTRSATAHSNLTVALYDSGGRLGVMLDSIHFSVAPGSTIYIPILLQNRSTEEDSFELNIEGIPAGWISTNSSITRLEPGASKEVLVTVHAQRAPGVRAGRNPFKLLFTSLNHADQSAEVDCILTVMTYSGFSASLQSDNLLSDQGANLIINNEGNTEAVYTVSFQSPGNALLFEKGVPVSPASFQHGEGSIEIQYAEIPLEDVVQISAGTKGIYPFRARLRSRPIFGDLRTYPFTVNVTASDNKTIDLRGELNEKAFVPTWLASATLIGLVLFCAIALLALLGIRNSSPSAIQTAAANQTQIALGGQDPDADGLSSTQESQLGTDPNNIDTDHDGLSDGEEVNVYKTNPLIADTDQDGLTDGQEVKQYQTNALTPDTDQDGLNDGAEIAAGTNPLKPDTDNDGLLDGQENQTCPSFLKPDSDNDGIIDGKDLEPCNPANPALTATTMAGQPTFTPTIPTAIPTTLPTIIPTIMPTIVPTLIPTGIVPTTIPGLATPTVVLPNIQGIILFESSRSGNNEIYAMNAADKSTTQVTNSPGVDTQPALAPDSVRIAYVSNQNGNNEIFLTGLDHRAPINLTNSTADDQNPTWSPDGNWIAFTSNRSGNQDIYIMHSDGTQVHALTTDATNEFSPTWFSEKRLLGSEEWIAFTTNRDGNLEIYKVRPDGTGLTNLTKNPGNDYTPAGMYNGGLLAFVSDRDGNPEIYTMTDDGGAPTNITNNLAQDVDPALDPSGNWILFSSNRDGNLEVYLVGTGGGTVYNVTRNSGEDRYPNW